MTNRVAVTNRVPVTNRVAVTPAPDSGVGSAGSASDSVPNSLDGTLSALADPVRRQVIDLLARSPHRAGELASRVGSSPSAMSKHLRVLKRHGLVVESHPEFDSRVRLYSLRTAPVTELRNWLDLAEAAWAQQLNAFARHVEATEAASDSPGTAR